MGREKITERAASEEELKTLVRHQETVAALGQLALAGRDLDTLLARALERIASGLEVEYVRLLELEPDGTALTLRAGRGWDAASALERISATPDTQAGFTLAAGEPVIVSDHAAEKRFSTSAAMRERGIVSGITVVVPGSPQPYGVLAAHSTVRREFSQEDVRFLRSVANILAMTIQGRGEAEARRGGEARLRAIVETAVDGIITIDQRGIVEALNPAAERLFGYAGSDVVGKNVSMLMPDPYHSMHDTYLQNYLRTGKAKIIGIGREVMGKRKDGTTFPMDLSVSEFRLGERRMFVGLVHDVSERRRLEREILDAAADEQRRIGHDLHDGLCQQLAGVAFATEVLLQKLMARSAGEAATVQKIGQMVDDAITQARQLARGLQPVTLEASGLASALRELAAKVEEVFRVSCVFDCERIVLVSDNAIATHLFRIAQEAVNNAIKHGKARTIIIELAVESGNVVLTVRDNGLGVGGSGGDGKGIGLHSMAYRARLIGGTFDIRPGQRGGTMVTCIVPMAGVVEGTEHASQEESTATEASAAGEAVIPVKAGGRRSGPSRGKKAARAGRG